MSGSDPDIWIGLVNGVPVEPGEDDIGGAFVHLLARAGDSAEFRAAADEALAEHDFHLTGIDEAEPLRDRLRTGRSVAPELLELALDAALAGEAQLGEFFTYPPEDHDPAEAVASGMDARRAELRELAAERTLVSVRSHYDWHHTIGYIAAVGAAWALVQLVDSCGLADGFRAVKLETVSEIEPVDEAESLLPRLLAVRPIRASAPVRALDDARDVLLAARDQAPLVHLVTDDMPPGAFWIGSVTALDDEGVVLCKLSPTAEWQDEDHFSYAALTRIGFGGRYADALAAASGADRP